jgi:hypothetical protein
MDCPLKLITGAESGLQSIGLSLGLVAENIVKITMSLIL